MLRYRTRYSDGHTPDLDAIHWAQFSAGPPPQTVDVKERLQRSDKKRKQIAKDTANIVLHFHGYGPAHTEPVYLERGLHVVRYVSQGVPVSLLLLAPENDDIVLTVFENQFGSCSASLDVPDAGFYAFGVQPIRGASYAHTWRIAIEQL